MLKHILFPVCNRKYHNLLGNSSTANLVLARHTLQGPQLRPTKLKTAGHDPLRHKEEVS